MLPLELTRQNTWVVAKKDSKIPINARTGNLASVSKSNTWCDFKTAYSAVLGGKYANLGFVFTNCGLVGIDIDNAFDENGVLTKETAQIIELCKSYTEISRSGRGIHIIVAGDLPFSGKNNGKKMEIYKDGRYFVLTGNVLKYKEITSNQQAIDWVISRYFSIKTRTLIMYKKSIPQIDPKVTIDFRLNGKKIEWRYPYKRIREGCRNIALTSITGTLKNSGYSRLSAFKMIQKINQIACPNPLDLGEIKNIVRSIYRYAD